jgi:hypothetical protein
VSQSEYDQRWDAIFRRDGLEDEAPSTSEAEEIDFRCTCGKPLEPGIVHRADAPCYVLGGRA